MRNQIKTGRKHEVELVVDILIYKEGDYIVSYCPSLELSSFGKTLNEAKEAIEEAIHAFIDEIRDRGTIDKVLLELGWTLKKLPKAEYNPPAPIIHNKIMSRFQEKLSVPV